MVEVTAARPHVVVAVDGGGSKTDVAVVDLATGAVLAGSRGGGCSHHIIGIDAAVAVIDSLVSAALADADVGPAQVVHAGCYLTAIDLPDESEAMLRRLQGLAWGAASVYVDNDVFALLRTGTDSPDAAAVVCGTGINGAAVRADGEVARIVALGATSGDWGGASGLAEEVLWHAARAEDGRGEPTALRAALLSWTGRTSVHDVIIAVHRGELSAATWWPRMSDVFAIADSGDAVAASLVDRQGREIGLLAASLLDRLGLAGSEVPVVLGGGIASSGHPRLMAALALVLEDRAPLARPVVVTEAPITGAVELALTRAGSLVAGRLGLGE